MATGGRMAAVRMAALDWYQGRDPLGPASGAGPGTLPSSSSDLRRRSRPRMATATPASSAAAANGASATTV